MKCRKNIVIFCGGKGALKIIKSLMNKCDCNITAIINGYDDGKSAGIIRRMYNMLGPPDIRKIQLEYYRNSKLMNDGLLRLIDHQANDRYELIEFLEHPKKFIAPFNIKKNDELYIIEKLENFKRRLDEYTYFEDFSNFSIGNCLYASAYNSLSDNLEQATIEIGKLLKINHSVLTISNESLYLCAVDDLGHVYSSESEIDTSFNARFKNFYTVADYRNLNNKLLFDGSLDEKCKFLDSLNKTAQLNKSAVQSILDANIIIYAPGTRSTSFLPIFYNKDVFDIISKNLSAFKFFICNLNSVYKYHYRNPLEELDSFLHYSNNHNVTDLINYCLIDNSFLKFNRKLSKFEFVSIFEHLTHDMLYHDGDKVVEIINSLQND